MSDSSSQYQTLSQILASTSRFFFKIVRPCLPLMILVTGVYFLPWIFLKPYLGAETRSIALMIGFALYNLLLVGLFVPILLHWMHHLSVSSSATLVTSCQAAMNKFTVVFFNVMMTYALIYTGFLAFYIPGLFLLFKFMFCMPFILFEDAGLFKAIVSSWCLTRGAWFQTFTLFALVSFSGVFFMAFLEQLLKSYGAWIPIIVDLLVGSVTSLFMLVLLLVQFENLKVFQEQRTMQTRLES